jgi:hypothetical protein
MIFRKKASNKSETVQEQHEAGTERLLEEQGKEQVEEQAEEQAKEKAEEQAEKKVERETYSENDSKKMDKELVDEDLDEQHKKDELTKGQSEWDPKSGTSNEENTNQETDHEKIVNQDINKMEKSGGKNLSNNPENVPDFVAGSELNLKEASELAKKKLSEALNKPANATISIEDSGEYWLAVVEIVEEEYLPGQNLKSMNDLLGVYEIKLSHQGKLLKWSRKGSYKRAEIK